MKDDAVYLRHALYCIRRIEEDTGSGFDTFNLSKTIQDAVLRNLQVLAASTQRDSEGLKARWPEVEWARIASFRNVLVHDYLGIDMERIWAIAQQDVPELKKTLERMLRDLGQA